MKLIGSIKLIYFSLALACFASADARAQALPEMFTVEGRLYDNGVAASGTSLFKLEVVDPGKPECVLYHEEHTVNLTSTTGSNGFYAVILGTGANTFAPQPLSRVFVNGVPLFGTEDITNLPCTSTGGIGAVRAIRLNVSLNGGAMTHMSPDTIVTPAPTAMVANSLQGLTADKFLQPDGANLDQTNLNTLFASWTRLQQLLAGTGDVGFGGKLTGITDPTAAQDAATKNYADTRLAGESVDRTGFSAAATDNGKVLVWSNGSWVAQTPSMTDNTKLPLTGGTINGALAIGTTGMLYLRQSSGAIAMGASHAGAIYFGTSEKFLQVWDGTNLYKQAFLDPATNKLNAAWLPTISGTTPGGNAGGSLAGQYPNPTIAAAAIGTTELANDAVRTGNINSGAIALNQLLMTGGTFGERLEAKTCANNEVLKFQTTPPAGWYCATISSLAPVTKVAGKTGDVVLNANDIVGVKTAALYDVGIGSTQVPQLNLSGKLETSTIPLHAGDVTGSIATTVVTKIQGVPVVTTAPTSNYALIYNGSAWAPAAIGSDQIQDAAVTNNKIAQVGVEKIESSAGSYFKYKPNNGACLTGGMLRYDGTNWICTANFVQIAGGNVGIGITNPANPLDVSGKIRALVSGTANPTALILQNSDNTAPSSVNVSFQTANILNTTREIARITGVMTTNSNTTETGAIAFQTRASGVLHERMRIIDNGNVGIGTTNPGARFEIADLSSANIGLYNTTGTNGRYYSLASKSDGNFELLDDSASLARIRITKEGNVAIGDTIPNAVLTVKGDVVQSPVSTGTAIQFSDGNMQYTGVNCQAMTLSGIKNGGTYVLAVQGNGAGTCSFTAAGFTVKAGTTIMGTSGGHLVFTFIVLNGYVYVASAYDY